MLTTKVTKYFTKVTKKDRINFVFFVDFFPVFFVVMFFKRIELNETHSQ